MLDTVLEIGRVLRASPTGLRHHRYIKHAPIPDEKNPVRFWRIPTSFDGKFDFSKRELLIDENRQQQLYYLNFKQSDADSTKPYVYGDIYRTITKTGEDGNFRFGDPNKGSWMALNSFQRAEKINALLTDRTDQFRSCFRDQLQAIETFLRENTHIYIHFDFEGYHWYKLEELEILNRGLVSTFFDKVDRGFVSRAFLYKTLMSSSSSTPGFNDTYRHRNRLFRSEEQALDLVYGVNYASRQALRIRDIKIVVLPRGEGLTAEQIERFFQRVDTSYTLDSTGEAEAEIQHEVENVKRLEDTDDETEALFRMLSNDPQTRDIAQFDFVFSLAGGTKADIDMIELAGLERSNLSQIQARIKKLRDETEAERNEFLLSVYGKPPKKAYPGLKIATAFETILSNKTRAEKKYQSHLYKVLPQIYTGTYYNDPVLLPAFIEKTEFNLRNDGTGFNQLKFDFYFLTRLSNSEGDRLVKIQSSPSYRVGVLLGKLARGLRTKINSFDKNYAGLLSRRIGTLNEVMSLQNEFNQKLIMHYQGPWWSKITHELCQEIKDFTGRYDKNECAFGFFESYFSPRPQEELTEESIPTETVILEGPEEDTTHS